MHEKCCSNLANINKPNWWPSPLRIIRTKCFVPTHFAVLLSKAGNYYAFNIEAFKTLALSNIVMGVSQSSEVSMLRSDHFSSLADSGSLKIMYSLPMLVEFREAQRPHNWRAH